MENEEILIKEDIEPTPEGVNEGVNEVSSFDDNTTPPAVLEPFVIPNIYNYDDITKEFTGLVEQADKDNAKSALVGHFVPMVHANATLLEPPEVEENQIQVHSKTIETHEEPYEVVDEDGEKHIEYKTVTEVIENWNIEADYRKNFYKVDNDLNVSEINTIGEQEGYIIVDKEIGEDIKVNKGWYKIVDGEIVKKSDEEYEQEQTEKEVQRVAMLHLTRGDVFRGLLLAKGVTRAQLRAVIEALPEKTNEQSIKKEMALIDFDDALEFYRGNALVDTVGAQLGITPEQMNKFFETNDWQTLLKEVEE